MTSFEFFNSLKPNLIFSFVYISFCWSFFTFLGSSVSILSICGRLKLDHSFNLCFLFLDSVILSDSTEHGLCDYILFDGVLLLLLWESFDTVDNLSESGVDLRQIALLIHSGGGEDGFLRISQSQIHVCGNVVDILHFIRLLYHFSNCRKQILKLSLVLETNWLTAFLVDQLDDSAQDTKTIKARPNETIIQRSSARRVINFWRVRNMVLSNWNNLDLFRRDGKASDSPILGQAHDNRLWGPNHRRFRSCTSRLRVILVVFIHTIAHNCRCYLV